MNLSLLEKVAEWRCLAAATSHDNVRMAINLCADELEAELLAATEPCSCVTKHGSTVGASHRFDCNWGVGGHGSQTGVIEIGDRRASGTEPRCLKDGLCDSVTCVDCADIRTASTEPTQRKRDSYARHNIVADSRNDAPQPDCTCWKDEHYSLNQRMCAVHKDAQPEPECRCYGTGHDRNTEGCVYFDSQPEPEDTLADELEACLAWVGPEKLDRGVIRRAAAALRAVSQPTREQIVGAIEPFLESYASPEQIADAVLALYSKSEAKP